MTPPLLENPLTEDDLFSYIDRRAIEQFRPVFPTAIQNTVHAFAAAADCGTFEGWGQARLRRAMARHAANLLLGLRPPPLR